METEHVVSGEITHRESFPYGIQPHGFAAVLRVWLGATNARCTARPATVYRRRYVFEKGAAAHRHSCWGDVARYIVQTNKSESKSPAIELRSREPDHCLSP